MLATCKYNDVGCVTLVGGALKNDRLDGREGNDVLVGDHDIGPISDFGADNLKGGPGDDRLFQNGVGSEPPREPITSDGFKDILDCGDGNDEAWVNVNTDQDEFKNCEVVHRG
jgi:Ca2+-binding RTX toxin-like protein